MVIECGECQGTGSVRSWRMSPEADCDLEECRECRGEGYATAAGTADCDDGRCGGCDACYREAEAVATLADGASL